jgi:hypothetical protein
MSVQPATAATQICDSTHPIIGQNVSGDVVVSPFESCEITNSTIGGNLTLGQGSSTQVASSTIRGSVNATNAPLYLRLGAADPVSIGGHVNISGVTGPQSYICNGTTIGGNVNLTNNGGQGVDVGSPALCADSGPTIRGRITITGNVADMNLERTRVAGATVTDNCGGGTVKDNAISGFLQVLRNEPDYVVSGNTAGATTVNQTGAPVGCTPPNV